MAAASKGKTADSPRSSPQPAQSRQTDARAGKAGFQALAVLRRYRMPIHSMCALALAFYVVTVSSAAPEKGDPVTRTLARSVKPLQKSLHALGSTIRNIQINYVAFKDLWNENQALKEQIAALEAERNRLFEAKLANDRLTELLEIRTRILRESVAATVISNSASSWFRTITVGKGAGSGIHRGMAVITPRGVVGRVVSVADDTAKVLLLTDHKSGIDIITQRTRVRGIVSGSVDGEPIVKYMGRNDDIRPGDRLITSGLDGTFPKGLLVGTIVEVADDGPGLFRRVRVSLAVDPLVMEEVLFISDKPRPAYSSTPHRNPQATPSATP